MTLNIAFGLRYCTWQQKCGKRHTKTSSTATLPEHVSRVSATRYPTGMVTAMTKAKTLAITLLFPWYNTSTKIAGMYIPKVVEHPAD